MLSHSFAIIKQHRRAFLTAQLGYYGIIAIAMCAAMAHPQLQADAWERTNLQLDTSSLGRYVKAAYEDKRVGLAAVVTFVVNLLLGSGIITLLSLAVPFSGLTVALYRAIEWGLLFAPLQPRVLTLPHALTMIIEGQAYVLASFAAWIQGMDMCYQIRARYGSTKKQEDADDTRSNRWWWPSYRRGWQCTKELYKLIALVLAVAAVWEAYEVIHMPGTLV
ncbi:hypothetical protein IAU60_002476 [Kwoniella sp. DSM 27419]